MIERWRWIAGYEGRYLVSTLGRVWSVPRERTRGGLRKPVRDGSGYLEVKLGHADRRRLHRLVLETFVGPANGMHACHGDGDEDNNALSNLRWDTPAENVCDIIRHGRNRNRQKTHCPVGHEYTAENTNWSSPKAGRQCRTCKRERDRLRYLRRSA